MEIIKDERKKKLYNIINQMYLLIQKEKFSDYVELKQTYGILFHNIFGKGKGIKGDESFEWDLAMNFLDGIYNAKIFFDSKAINKEKYEETKKSFEIKFLNLREGLENYLK